mgnify:FL=1
MIYRIRNSEKGQYSTFMKPILIMIFGMLLISLLTSTLNFNVGLEQDRQATEFQSTPIEVFSDVSSCLSVDQSVSSSNTVLNQTKLEEMDMKYNSREPECAETFSSGYQINIKQDFLKSVEVNRIGTKIDLAFVIDTSGSVTSDDLVILCNIKDDVIDSLEKQGADVKFKVYGLEGTPGCANQYLNAGHVENWAKGTKMLVNSGMWRSDSKKVIFPMSDECPYEGGIDGSSCNNGDQASIDDAENELSSTDIEVYPIWGDDMPSKGKNYMDQLATSTGGEVTSSTGSTGDLANFIVGAAGGGGYTYESGESSCSLPPVRSYNASAQIVINSDASDDYDQHWNAICSQVNNSVEKLEAQGLDTEVSYYTPGQPASSSTGQGNPMQVSGSDYDFSTNVPSCIDTTYNGAATSSYGKGITEWNSTGLVDYNSSKDYGLEAWGVSSKWILENHNWNNSKDVRMMFVLGDQDPTGGNSTGENFRKTSGTKLLDNETEIVNNVTNLSDQYNVNIYTMSDNLEYSAQDRYGDSTVNDAEELMKLAASESGGERIIYGSVNELSERFEEQFYSLSEQGNEGAGTCKNVSYNFGDTNISDEGVEESLISIFPVSVRQSKNLTTPAEMELRLTQSPLQRVVGTINKAISNGEMLNDNITVSSRINNDREISVKNTIFNRKNKTTYGLRTTSGNTDIEVNDGLIIGVNGREVFRRMSPGVTTIDFSDSSNQFEAYKGASLQVVGLHTDQPGLKLDSLELYCVNGCHNNGQEINPNLIQADKGTNKYRELGGLGAFYHNFTGIEIGKTTDVTQKGVCYENTGNCKALRSDEVEDLSLRPGSHNLQAKYSTTGGVTFQ